MKINNHVLSGENIEYIDSLNYKKEFSPKNLKYLIMHYTGGTTLEGAIETFKNEKLKVSAHLIIGRDGKIVQMVPFNYIAWHAGKSKWGELKNLNNYSIGIEFVNAGKLKKSLNGYKDDWGHSFPPFEVYMCADSNEISYWHLFTNKQIERGIEVSKLLMKEYNLIDILGHRDISPGRKIDPGYAFPLLEKFK